VRLSAVAQERGPADALGHVRECFVVEQRVVREVSAGRERRLRQQMRARAEQRGLTLDRPFGNHPRERSGRGGDE